MPLPASLRAPDPHSPPRGDARPSAENSAADRRCCRPGNEEVWVCLPPTRCAWCVENHFSDHKNDHRSLNPGSPQWPETPSASFLVPRCFKMLAATRFPPLIVTLVSRWPGTRSSSVEGGFSDRSLSQFSFLSGNRLRVEFPGVFSAQPCPATRSHPLHATVKAGFPPGVRIASGSLLPCSTTRPRPPPPFGPHGLSLGKTGGRRAVAHRGVFSRQPCEGCVVF